jgi:CRP/FNR family transcriptional regulator
MELLPKAHPTNLRRRSCAAAECSACPVRELTFCAALNDSEIGELDGISSHVRLRADELLFQEGDPAVHVFNVVRGAIKLYKLLPDGRRQITGFLFTGDFLGLASRQGYAYGAEALVPCELCRFPRERLETLFDQFPGMQRRLREFANDELAAAQDQMLLLGRKTATEKVASFLLTLRQRENGENGDLSIPLLMNRSDIADYLGLTVETVSRTFTRLKADGIIDLPDSRDVTVCKPEALTELSEG